MHSKKTQHVLYAPVNYTFGQLCRDFIGFSFERHYLMEGLNLMIVKSTKTTYFGETMQILMKITDFVKSAKSVKSAKTGKSTKTMKSTKNCKIREIWKIQGFLCEMKDHVPKKVTPVFCRIRRQAIFGSLALKANEPI